MAIRVVHRDYTRLGATHVRWESDQIDISNPGGFVEGVTLDNLLIVEPRPRNPLLADAIKRIGLTERTGRGVDLIYQGLLRFGRALPDYSRSDAHSVVVVLPGGEADIGLLRIVVEQENRQGAPLPVDSLIALALLRRERRVDTAMLAVAKGHGSIIITANPLRHRGMPGLPYADARAGYNFKLPTDTRVTA